jgi:hypothetical protein
VGPITSRRKKRPCSAPGYVEAEAAQVRPRP